MNTTAARARALYLSVVAACAPLLACSHASPVSATHADDADEGATATPPAQTKIGGIPVGSAAPDFTLADTAGEQVSLATLRALGPVVVVFYRGDWCPICRKQLSELQANLERFAAKGAQVVAVSVDDVQKNAALAGKLGVSFPVLADPDLATIRAYEVEHEGEDIARPSTYVIGGDGRVAWAWVGERAGDRPALDHILAAIPSNQR